MLRGSVKQKSFASRSLLLSLLRLSHCRENPHSNGFCGTTREHDLSSVSS